VQNQLPAQWNEWLFTRPVPIAWVNMLLHIAKRDRDRAAFDKWPLVLVKPGDVLGGMIQKVLQIAQDRACQVWYTNLGYVSSSIGLLANGDEPSALRKALHEVGIPVIYLPDTLLDAVRSSNVVERLSPNSLCSRLEKDIYKLREVSEDAKRVLLEYVLSDPSFCKYGAIELFPFEDGTYKSIDGFVAFVPRGKDESALFDRDRSRSVDCGKLSETTIQFLRDGLLDSSLHASLQTRSSNDLKAYCMSTYFKEFDPDQDFAFLDKDIQTFVSKVWDWIIARGYSLAERDLSCLWLVPLSNGQHRKLKPQHQSSGTILAPPGEIGDFLRKLATIDRVSNKPIVISDSLSSQALKLLMDASVNDSGMLVKNGAVLDDLCLWLKIIPKVLERVCDADKLRLHKLLVSHRYLCRDFSAISNTLRQLKLFQEMTWTLENNLEPSLSWTSLNGYSKAIGLRGNVPLPQNTETIFLDARSEITRRFLTEFDLAACPSTIDLLEEYVIFYWERGYFGGLSTSCKEHTARLFLSHLYNFEKQTQERVASLAFIPTCRVDGKTISKFAKAAHLIDSCSDLLRSLYFDDEEVYPAKWAIDEFRGVLIGCGLQNSVTEDLVKGRIRCFVSRNFGIAKTWDRARNLLQSKVDWLPGTDTELSAIIRQLEWLPAMDCNRKKILASASHCRRFEDRLLVGLVLPLVEFDIMADWRQRLGWNEVIPSAMLLEQLKHGIGKEDGEIVNAVLKYIQVKGQSEILSKELVNLRCVMTQVGRFVSPQVVFHTGCERLEPYLHNVDNNFWNKNSLLLSRLEIKKRPGLEDLIRVQTELQQKLESKEGATLDKRDTSVAVEVAKLAAVFDRKQLSNLMVITALGRLCKLEEVTYNDLGSLWHAQGEINFTHPNIPYAISLKLRIEPLSERVKKGELDLADEDDEDEFDQHEQVATGIADTLERYPVEATFKEYLANADDADAREINWLLDSTQYPQESLVSPGLSAYQGSALLVHNDGVFQDKDFDGFKDVGRGSKREDTTTIGKFGRGSQTMYHWTDVPMLLSGEYLLILE
jgi:sacsin